MLNLLVGQPIEEPLDFEQLNNRDKIIYISFIIFLIIITIIFFKLS
jgi:hypothetical protein